MFVCRAAVMLEVGLTPWGGAGGWGDWPGPFVDALSIVLEVKSDCAEAEQRRATQNAR